jgi:glycyl-tRNA synthetase beta chain
MTELLLELYSEEIPALMQSRAEQVFKRLFSDAFFSKNISFKDLQIFSGPCRITIYAQGIGAEIPGYLIEKKGPRVEADQKAIEGFAKSVGQDVSSLDIQDNKGTKFYIYREQIPARPTEEILPELIESILNDFVWPKSMQWGAHDISWIRPLKNILCLYNNKVLKMKFSHLESNNITFGHKFLNFKPLDIASFQDYQQKLEQNLVVISREERGAIIQQQLDDLLKQYNLELNVDQGLMEEVIGLVEFPQMMIGTIPDKFLSVPYEILISAMRTHQKYFTAFDKNGKFAPYFIFASNIKPSELVVNGNEKVLSARLSDAKFFYEHDLKTSLETMYERLAKVTFHAKLGTVKDKADRIAVIANYLLPSNQALTQALTQAAKFCKCDLVSGVVSEFPELQGIMGRYYAVASGLSAEVAQAISEHYQPLGPNDKVPNGISAYLSIADKIDSLAGLYLAGERATGSGDPFSLRRYALGIINTITTNQLNISLVALVEFTVKQLINTFPPLAQDNRAAKSIISFLEERAKNLLKDKFEINLVNAVVKLNKDSNLVSIIAKLKALQNFTSSEQGIVLLQAFKRAYNILSQEEKKFKAGIREEVDPSILQEDDEKELVKFLTQLKAEVNQLLSDNLFEQALGKLSSLHAPLGKFFDNVIVVSSDIDLTENRLSMLKSIVNLFSKFADFNELV